MTNYEKIKAMSIDEMAELLYDTTFNDFVCNSCKAPNYCNGGIDECKEGIKQWLEQESEEE